MYAVIDIETGGFSKTKNAICEIAILVFNQDFELVREFQTLIAPYPRNAEVAEEAGIDVELGKDIVYCGGMGGMNNDGGEFSVFVYAGFTHRTLKTMEEEKIVLVKEDELSKRPHIQNVPALIQLCRYKLTAEQSGSRFNEFWMKY